jgi:GNAT superfamily N-acetyltransferase
LPIFALPMGRTARGTFKMKASHHKSPAVRVAAPEDAERLAPLAHQLLVFERSLDEAAGELTPWAATAGELRKQIQQPNTRFFIAERDGELVGYLKAVIHGRALGSGEIGGARWLRGKIERAARRLFNFALRRPRPNVEIAGGYIAGAFVEPGARRTSVGRALVAAAESWFRVQGLATSELHVLYSNEGARRFWEEIGYQPIALGLRKKL